MEADGSGWNSVEVGAWFSNTHCLFGVVKLSKNTDPGKYCFSGYAIRLDSRLLFLISDFDFGKMFWFLVQKIVHQHILITKKNFFLGEGPTQRIIRNYNTIRD